MNEEVLRKIVFWSGLAIGLSFLVQAAATASPALLLGGVAGILGAMFIMFGRRPDSAEERRRNQILSVGIIIAFVTLGVLLTAFPVSPKANTVVMTVVLGLAIVWAMWRQFGHKRPG